MTHRPLNEYTTAITSGLTPQHKTRPVLGDERAAVLHKQLRQLAEARQQAAMDLRHPAAS